MPQPNLTLNPINVSYARQFLGDSSANVITNLWVYSTDPVYDEYFREQSG